MGRSCPGLSLEYHCHRIGRPYDGAVRRSKPAGAWQRIRAQELIIASEDRLLGYVMVSMQSAVCFPARAYVPDAGRCSCCCASIRSGSQFRRVRHS